MDDDNCMSDVDIIGVDREMALRADGAIPTEDTNVSTALKENENKREPEEVVLDIEGE